MVNGYLALAMIATLMLIAIVICCSVKGILLFVGYIFLTFLTSLFSIAWLIVGAIMFWGYLYPKNLCQSSVSGYMFARLILGFISVIINLFTSRRQQKQASPDSP